MYTGPVVPKPDVASTNYAKETVHVGQKCTECNKVKVHENVRRHVGSSSMADMRDFVHTPV